MNLVGVKELALFLRVSEKSIYRYVTHGEIPFLRIGKHLRFDQDAVLSHLQSRVASNSSLIQGKTTVSLAEAREKRCLQRGVLSDNSEGSLATSKGVGNGN